MEILPYLQSEGHFAERHSDRFSYTEVLIS